MAGFYIIVVTPALTVFGLVFLWILGILFAVPIMLILAVIYIRILFGGTAYGPDQLRQINIPDAPDHVVDLLKTTTIRGDLINVHLVAAFEGGMKFNQTDLANYVRDHNKVTLTQQAIREQYILKLERRGIIYSDAVSKEKAYKLTSEKGQWCLKAVKTCFPRTNFWFAVRHQLGIMKLPKYPDIENEKTAVNVANG